MLHKGGYDVAVMNADSNAAARIALLDRLPQRCLLEPLRHVVPFADRRDVCRMLETLLSKGVHQPRFVPLHGPFDRMRASVSASALRYPLLCKPAAACGPSGHKLLLVLREAGLADLAKGDSSGAEFGGCGCGAGEGAGEAGDGGEGDEGTTWLAQEYIDHGGVVIKAYAVGRLVHVTTRPSLPDLGSCHPTSRGGGGGGASHVRDGSVTSEEHCSTHAPAAIRIDSQQPLGQSAEELLGYRVADHAPAPLLASALPVRSEARNAASPEAGRRREIEAILAHVKAAFEVELLGIDLIVASDGTMLVIDANHFPSSPRSVPGFTRALSQTILAHGEGGRGTWPCIWRA